MRNVRKREDVFNEYKLSEDKELIIDDEVYYKIIDIYKIAKYNLIMLPNEIFRKKGSFLKDEKGNVFEIDSPMHCSFVGVVPEWYMKSLTYIIKDIDLYIEARTTA